MVWTEIIKCDVCGKEINFKDKKGRTICAEVSISANKRLLEKLGIKNLAHGRKRMIRKNYGIMTIDVCSKECIAELLVRMTHVES